MKNILNKGKREDIPKTKIDYFAETLTNLLYAIAVYFVLKKFFSIDVLDFSSENINHIKSILLPSKIDEDYKLFFVYVVLAFFISQTIFNSIVKNVLLTILKRDNLNSYDYNNEKR